MKTADQAEAQPAVGASEGNPKRTKAGHTAEPAADQGARYARGIARDKEKGQKDGYYPTPDFITRALLRLEDLGPSIWEPACGEGHMSLELEAAGRDVISTDLVDRGFGTPRVDFLMERRLLAPEVVTNPPFHLAEEFLLHAVELGASKIVLLLRLAWLEGLERMAIFKRLPPARVHVSSRRIPFARDGKDRGKGGSSMVAFAFFVWEAPFTGPTELRWFDWKE